ncbi:amino acid permease [Cyanobium sp. Aljojuca 7D2]|uniref:APC family permease n=1 Tax=Cyanobium sp. Aljojuca 7D2 TaxID=2823698 RepID=UPI0020CDF4E5|nr:APC family permease [Cyanobium sp. Aljojuca 7D2]MCP9890753.1 amino acid permease [Cyanobium sp. Aljojuca 7D2]
MSQPAPGRLLDILGLGFGLAGAVGGTIGAGILRTPGLVAAQLPSPALVLAVWLAGGVYALLGAVCIAELAAALPQAGGWYVYAERAFGRQVGFLVGWTDWLAHCIGLAWVATTVGDYSLALLPADLLPAGMPLEGSISKGLALLAIGLFSLIQLRGLRAGSTSQELLSLAKAVAFLALVAACFLLPIPTAAPIAPLSAEPMATLGWRNLSLAVVLALQAVITTYDGWASPVYFAEEFSEPGRDLPRSLIGGVLAVLVLYLLINLALLHVLPIAQLASSSLPAAAAAQALAGPLGGLLITAIALVSLLGLINTVVMAAPRILFGLSRDGLLPSAVAAVNGGGTPAAALLITSTAAAALVLAGSFERLLAMGAVLYVSLPLAGIAALLALRRQEPNLPRPFRAWGYPLSPLLVAAVSLAFLVGTALGDWVDSLAALVLVALGYAASRLAAGPAGAEEPG